MAVKEIVEQWLREHGYDGLCTYDCGCRLDDLMPCAGGGYAPVDADAIAECVPGHLRRCTDPDCYCEGQMEHVIADEETSDGKTIENP